MSNIDNTFTAEEKLTAAVQKTMARLAAVGACYNRILLNKEISANKVLEVMYGFKIEDSPPVNEKYFIILTKALKFHFLEAQLAAEDFLINGRKFSQISKIYQAILITAGCEFKECDKTPSRVIINEYTNIASSFGDDLITGFINALLDKLSKILRNNIKIID